MGNKCKTDLLASLKEIYIYKKKRSLAFGSGCGLPQTYVYPFLLGQQ